MHVALDGTPLLGQRTGIGRYTEQLLGALAQRDDLTVSATAFTSRGSRSLATAVPDSVRTRSLPLPARALQAAWAHAEFPPVELLSGRCDVFHATNFVLPPLVRAAGVVTIHDIAYLTMPETVNATSRRLLDLVPRSLSRAAAVCTPTQAVADQLRDAYGPVVSDVFVTPLGIDRAWLETDPPSEADRHRLAIPSDYFLFVGTREPRKDLSTLITAYAQFRAGRNAHGEGLPRLVLVGPRGWGEDSESTSRVEPGAAAGIDVLGYLAAEDLRLVVAGARALVMPSRDEGFGLPALEGLATGVPVIVSSVPALVEVTGGQATVFGIGDVDGLAEALRDAAAPLDQGSADTARARRRSYASRWTWQRCAEATIAAYRFAMGR